MQDHEADVAYLMNGNGEVIMLEHGASLVWVPEPLAEAAGYAPTASQIQAWVNQPEAGVSVSDVADLFELDD